MPRIVSYGQAVESIYFIDLFVCLSPRAMSTRIQLNILTQCARTQFSDQPTPGLPCPIDGALARRGHECDDLLGTRAAIGSAGRCQNAATAVTVIRLLLLRLRRHIPRQNTCVQRHHRWERTELHIGSVYDASELQYGESSCSSSIFLILFWFVCLESNIGKQINFQIVFTDPRNKAIFTNSDYGKTIVRRMLDFTPSEVSFYEQDPKTFLVLDKQDPERKVRIFGFFWVFLRHKEI